MYACNINLLMLMLSHGLDGGGGKVGMTSGLVVQYPRKPFSWVSPLVKKRTMTVSSFIIVVGGGTNPQCFPVMSRELDVSQGLQVYNS